MELSFEITPHFAYWDVYWGELLHDGDPRYPSIIYGFETVSAENQHRLSETAEIEAQGACYGYVQSGLVKVKDESGSGRVMLVQDEMFFSTANGATITFQEPGQAVVLQAVGFLGMNMCGGPIESKGRLKYIDRCSDSLLIAPPLLGDPCFNHLHFPSDIDQTEHTHPSTRAGMIARGAGYCITPAGEYPLIPGRLFHIPRNGHHRFRTDANSTMDVIAYHPDSDFGPTHEEHPMVNRTWVGGEKIDNTSGVHQKAEVVLGRGGVPVPVENGIG